MGTRLRSLAWTSIILLQLAEPAWGCDSDGYSPPSNLLSFFSFLPPYFYVIVGVGILPVLSLVLLKANKVRLLVAAIAVLPIMIAPLTFLTFALESYLAASTKPYPEYDYDVTDVGSYYFLNYLEGSYGAPVMVVSFLSAHIFLLLAARNKARRKLWLSFAAINLLYFVAFFIARSSVHTWFCL